MHSPSLLEETEIDASHLLLFTLDERHYALRLSDVEHVIRAAAVTPLPQTPEVVLGILDLNGSVVPVMDLRRRFRLPLRKISPDDQFVIARAGSRIVALVVDATEGVVEPGEAVPAQEVVPGACYLAGVTRSSDRLVLIHDLDSFLSAEEEESLAAALDQEGPA